ncbi:hypothetical protein [Oceanobacillus iheyensis HTE831]|uniref:YhfM-like domain-containing protein n=2 Tax=Oceanobacillus iheyensis TaxID=182710 RepID=Q8ETD7_OCEIH|nr:hypothetical protein [Oceanobacillus iheyensis HTE831]
MNSKKSYVFMSLLFIMLLTGCSFFGNGLIKGEVQTIRIAESNGFASEISNDFFNEIKDEEEIKQFKHAINSAVKQPGVVDMIDPVYDVELIINDEASQELYLWLYESSGSVMTVEDTNTVYSISEKEAEKLYNIVR